MRPQRCIAPLHGPEEGDCFRACLASILGMAAADVPNFVHTHRDDYVNAAREWLRQQGLTIFERHFSEEWSLDDVLKWVSGNSPDTPLILCGRCSIDHSDNHAVVALNGRIAHDPSGAGVDGPCVSKNEGDAYWWVYVVALSSAWTERKAA